MIRFRVRLDFAASRLTRLLAGTLLLPFCGVSLAQESPAASRSNRQMSIVKSDFGSLPSGERASLYTCTNDDGLVLKLTDYGAIVVSLEVPDREGKLADITLGFSRLEDYLQRHPYFGSTVGRYANRIAGGQFSLDGNTYRLAKNNGQNHLHGGLQGFDRFVWQAEGAIENDRVGVRFSRRSPDGEEGYPGNLDVTATYLLTNENALRIEFTATADAATVVNLANHTYWNLAGADSGTILDQELMIAADEYLPVDTELIPTGTPASVRNTPLDFTRPMAIGARMNQLEGDPVGYDHCFVLRSQDGALALAARARDPESGRVMEVTTTQPGVQFYTGNFLSGSASDGGFQQHAAFCLETQHYPDSPNQPAFPSTVLRPGETYRQVTVHRFLVE